MRYIKEYSLFSEKRKNNELHINEEFIGKILKRIGNKISLSISKKFGTAKEADKVFEEYKNELNKANQVKFEALKSYIQYEKDVKNGDDEDGGKKKDLLDKISKARKLYEQNVEIIKKKMEMKISPIISKEKNSDIKTYIEIKKLELQQEIISKELELINNEAGSEIVKNSDVSKILGIDTLQKTFDDSVKKSKESLDSLSRKDGFDFDKAKTDKNYNWESKYVKDYEFKESQEIIYWSNKSYERDKENYKGTTAYIGLDENQKDLEDGQIHITLKIGNDGFVISRGKIISTKEENIKSDLPPPTS